MIGISLSRSTNIIPLNNPLLPFRLGNSKIIESKHTFLHFVEINPLINHLDTIEYSYNILELLINQTLNNASLNSHHIHIHSNNLLNHAKYLILEVKTRLDNIKPHNRNKRGLINLVGKTSKWLFGVLDSDDAEKYDKAIAELQNHQDFSEKEVNLQISLTKQLINNYNKTITLLNQNQLLIKNHISTMEQDFNKRIIDLTTSIKAQNSIFQIILNCQNLITFLDNLEDAIMFAKLNTLHTAVISASELKQIITNLTAIYGESKIANFGNLKYYYQLAGLQVNFSKDKIIFAIHFPIFLEDLFEIFRLIPVPIHNTIFIPNLPYLIIGTELQQYEEEACPMIQDFYVCQNHLSPQLNDCAVALIKKAEIQHCEAVKVNVTTPIVQPITSRYVLVIPTETSVKIQKPCENNEITFINYPSLIDIPLNCGIITGNVRIWNKEELIEGRPLSLPPIKIETLTSPITNQNIIKLNSVDLDEIKDLQKQAELLTPIKSEAIHPATWSIATLGTTLVLIVIALTVIWQLYKRRGTHLREVIQEGITQFSENKPQSVLFSTSTGGVM